MKLHFESYTRVTARGGRAIAFNLHLNWSKAASQNALGFSKWHQMKTADAYFPQNSSFINQSLCTLGAPKHLAEPSIIYEGL
jgi:hypothetical protein